MYDGLVRLEFDEKTHRYTIYDGEKKVKAPSVTTILGVIDKSGPLIPWAINQTVNFYRAAFLPDTSYPTVVLDTIHEQAKRAARNVKEEAADIGTQAHNWLETYFKNGFVPQPLPEHPKVLNCVNAALAWLKEHDVRPIFNERRIYSRRYQYSGTLDMLALVDGVLTIVDWKSSRGLYKEFFLQTAAYSAAYTEETGTKIEQRILIRLGKDDGEFEPHALPKGQQAKDFKAFKAALTIHKYLQSFNKWWNG